jgi:hypothetical protein
VDKRFTFERNLLALSARNPELCSRLTAAETTLGRYRFPETRSREIVPALRDESGNAHPLHSMVDPRKEGERLVSTLKDEGFVVFLGLGGGFAAAAALRRDDVFLVLVVEYDINGIAELFCSKEYLDILGDPRFLLMVDPPPEALQACILEHYRPALSGGLRVFPLRARIDRDAARFGAAARAIQDSLEKISADYSVQAWFGTRWFSNIIRNLKTAGAQDTSFAPVRNAAICAAGPSLDDQLPLLASRLRGKNRPFVIAADTSLPCLLKEGLEPDAAVSIDCQHISCYHFMGINARKIPLFLDIASPPLLADFSDSPFFFSGGHPLALYISRYWRPIPRIDTSGANVTYACLSLAESLGAEHIEIFGADFSYPGGRVYARGSYVYPFFERRQNRFSTFEGLLSAFLYRSPFLPAEEPDAGAPPGEGGGAETGRGTDGPGRRCYETAALRMYRKRLEEKAALMEAGVYPVPGRGAPVRIRQERAEKRGPGQAGSRVLTLFASGKARMGAAEFLSLYRSGLAAIEIPRTGTGVFLLNLESEKRELLTTLLPQAAAFRRRRPELSAAEILREVKDHSLGEIDRVLAAYRSP